MANNVVLDLVIPVAPPLIAARAGITCPTSLVLIDQFVRIASFPTIRHASKDLLMRVLFKSWCSESNIN